MNSEDIKATFSDVVLSDWEMPINFKERDLPTFDISIYPEWVRKFIEGVALETQTPLDSAAMYGLAILSTSISGKFYIDVNKGSWKESLNTYTVVALKSSERKTAVFKIFLEPISEYELEEKQRLLPIINEKETERNTIIKRISYLQQQYSRDEDGEKNKNKMDEIKKLSKELEEPLIKVPRIFTSDVTPEKLAILMSENYGCISLLSDEGAEVFDMMAGKYGKVMNLDIYLKAFSGGNIKIDRANGTSLSIDNPIMTMGLYVQPSVIQTFPDNFSARGLTQRFLFSVPRSMVGSRKSNPPKIPIEVKLDYKNNVKKILRLQVKTPISLTFSKDAFRYLNSMSDELEEILRSPHLNDEFKSWIGKLPGQIIRISGLLHIAEFFPNNDVPKVISKDTLLKADRLRNYFIEHGKRAFGLIFNDENWEDAAYLINHITTSEKFKGKDKIDYQELYQNTKNGRFKTARELKKVLYFLEELNYLRMEREGRKNVIYLNPSIVK